MSDDTKGKELRAAIRTGTGVAPLRPETIDELWRFCQFMAHSPSLPDTYRKAGRNTPDYSPQEVQANLLMAVQTGAEIGLPPMQAVLSIAIINGRPHLWGDGLIAAVRGSGNCAFIKETVEGEGDKAVAKCHAKRIDTGEEGTATFSFAAAKAAGYADRNPIYKSRPARMLQMRARSMCLRDLFADYLKGVAGAAAEVAHEMTGDLHMTSDGTFEAAPKAERPKRERASRKAKTVTVSDEGGVIITDSASVEKALELIRSMMVSEGVDYEAVVANNIDMLESVAGDAMAEVMELLEQLRESAGDASTSTADGEPDPEPSGAAMADDQEVAEEGSSSSPSEGAQEPADGGSQSAGPGPEPEPTGIVITTTAGEALNYPQTKRGINDMLKDMSEVVARDGGNIFHLNEDLLDRIAAKAPDYAPAIDAIRAAAVSSQEAAAEDDNAEVSL